MKISAFSIRNTRRLLLAALAVIVAAAAAFGVLGCSRGAKVSFTVTELELYVGESRDMYHYVVFDPVTAPDKRFAVSSDSECVRTDGTCITAAAPGEAHVSAGGASVLVKVSYRPAINLRVEHDGALISTVSDGEEPGQIMFNASTDDNIDPASKIVWTVNGIKSGTGGEFLFAPPDYGEYIIGAAVETLYSESCVRVYRETQVEMSTVGALEQNRSFSPVVFYAHERADTRNPDTVYRWTVGGETACETDTFTFLPQSLGEYEIGLYVNGRRVFTGGDKDIIVTAVGDNAPDCSVRFDELGGVYVVWNECASVRSVSITQPDGTRKIYSRSDTQYGYSFTDSSFNATDIISVCAAQPGKYRIAVTAEATGAVYTFEQYPESVAGHISTNVLCNNTFLSSPEEGVQWIKELYACGISGRSQAYLARETDADKTAECAREAAGLFGLEIASLTVDGRYMNVELKPFVNSPTDVASADVRQIFAQPPHIEYGGTAAHRAENYIFPLERSRRTASVANTEQLVIAAESGVRPQPTANSNAQSVYRSAKRALLAIIGVGYDDRQKVHAIYDWLLWNTYRRDSADVQSSANYADGVFGNAAFSPTGAVTSAGVSKAFSVMCGLEGITSRLVSMPTEGGRYYWNKVLLDGLWYNVDVFCGDCNATESDSVQSVELMSHRGLLFDDTTAEAYGLVPCGERAYDMSAMYYLNKRSVGETYCDRYVDRSEWSNGQMLRAAVRGEFESTEPGSVKIQGVGKIFIVSVTMFAAEFMFDPELNEQQREFVLHELLYGALDYVRSKSASYDERLVTARIDGFTVLVTAPII